MLEVDTFLTALYVMVDDFCQSSCSLKRRLPGSVASLCPSEVVTLAIFARFASERDFYRYARSNLQDAFPTLPDRSQFNRLVCSQVRLIEEVALHLAVRTESCPATRPSPTGLRRPVGMVISTHTKRFRVTIC